MNDEKRDTLKRSLSSLIEDSFPEETGSLLKKDASEEPDLSLSAFNHDSKEKKAKIKASKAIDSLLRLYLDADVICDNEYIRARARLDKFSLYQILLSIEQMEHVIKILLIEIDNGNSSPRMFEVFGNLQRTRIDLIREFGNQLISMEESAKLTKNSIDSLGKSSDVTKTFSIDSSGGKGVLARGSKDLMKQIQQKKNEKNSDETTSEFE